MPAIIDRTSPKKKFVAKPVPTFRKQKDADNYWATEISRWRNGYSGLTGRHYFYLTQGTLLTLQGQLITPYWRDADDMIFREYEEAIRLYMDTMIVKRREIGLSSIFGGLEPIYQCLINPGSTSLLTSADKTRVHGLFKDKVLIMRNGLHPHIKPKKLFQDLNKTFLQFGEKDEDENIIGVSSQIRCVETAHSDKNAKAFESYRAKFIFLDELFLHDRAKMVHASAQATLMQGFVKEGHIVMGGSCGAATPSEEKDLVKGAQLGEELWYDAKALGIRTIFIPGWMGIAKAPEYTKDGAPTGKILHFEQNGHSNEKAATDWIHQRREQLHKAQDKKPYYNFIKQYPLTIQEVFDINRQKIFPDEIYDKLRDAKTVVERGDRPVKMFSLWTNPHTNKIESLANLKTGKFHILEHPKDGEEYIAGIDPIPFGNKAIDTGSDHCIIIYGRYSEEPKAYYAERNLNADYVIDNCIALQKYYASDRFPRGALALHENNRGEVMERVYRERAMLHLLAMRPRNLGIEYQDKKQQKYGWYANDKTVARSNDILVDWMLKNAEKLGLKRLIKEILRFPSGNNDVLDAFKSALILDKEVTKVQIDRWKAVEYTKRPVITMDKYGRSTRKWVKVPVHKNLQTSL